MSKSKIIKLRLPLLIFILWMVFVTALSGCGTGPDTATGGITPTPTGEATLTLSASSNVVSYGTPVTITATLRNSSGAAVNNAVVTFTVGGALVTFTPVSGTALTNATGVATIILNAASIDASGATSISASAVAGSSTVTSAPLGLALNAATVTLGSITLGLPEISAYGTSSVSVPVLINGVPATTPISVSFTSPCVSGGKATITSPVTTMAGTATSNYKDSNCASSSDVITASVSGGSTASATINVTPPTTNNIKFVSASPAIIGTQTSGATTLPKTSIVKFKVVDSNENGKANVDVTFSLMPASAPGGVKLSATTATSDANGEVATTVTSGTIPTPVWVVATVNGTTILTQSNTLTITTGLPTQNSFSLSVQTYNIEGWNYDGITSTLTVIASDRLGNPLPDGTAINFITEGAQIVPASCTTTSGTCTVTFRSADTRPVDGRITLVAYAIGEKSFIDLNGNNIYDAGETFYDLGDLYLDANENGQWDSGENFIASTVSGSSACLTQPGATPLPITSPDYWNVPSKQNTCSGVWEENYVRRSRVLVLSGSHANVSPAAMSGATCRMSRTFVLMDDRGNPMPAGSTIAIGSNYVNFRPVGSATFIKATITMDNGSPVLNTPDFGGTSFGLTVEGENCSTIPSGTFNVRVTTPRGLITDVPISVN